MAWLTTPSIWYRRKSKLVKGSIAGAQIDYQLKLTVYKGSGIDTVNTIYLGGYVNNDFRDLRFTSSDETTLLSYWIESYISGVSAIVWVKIDSIPADPFSKFIYIYYDNPIATTVSNGSTTFDFFDDFSGDLSKWNTAGSPTIVSGELTITGNGTWGAQAVRSVNTFTRPVIFEWKEKAPTTTMHLFAGYHNSFANAETLGLYKYVMNGKEYVQRNGTSVLYDFIAGGMPQTTNYVTYKLVILPTTGFQMYRDETAFIVGNSGTEDNRGIGFSVQNANTEKFDDVRARKYASPEPRTDIYSQPNSEFYTYRRRNMDK